MKETERQKFLRWLWTRPGNVRRAPAKEQRRQYNDAILKAVFTPLKP